MKTPVLCGMQGCVNTDSTIPNQITPVNNMDDTATFSSVGSNSNFEEKRDLLNLSEKAKTSMRRNMLSTPVFIYDEILAWRPAELMKKQSTKSFDTGFDETTVTVSLSHVPTMDYTLEYHKRVIEPTKYVSPFRKKIRALEMRNIDENASLSSVGSYDESIGSASTQSSQVDPTEYDGGSLPLQDVDANGKTILRDNLSDLPYLHEASILYNLAERNENNIPYTRAGGILVAINPLKWIEGLYSEEKRNLYSNHLVWHPKGNALDAIPPHVYEASSLAYRGMVIEGNNQSVIVSGETGAGKTISVKILMSHLATFGSKKIVESPPEHEAKTSGRRRSIFNYRPRFFKFKSEKSVIIQPPKEDDESDDDSLLDILFEEDDHKKATDPPETVAKLNLIVQRVLDADVLLEAFGNAKTQRNDNSSRFSKYTRLQFDVEFMGHATPSCTLAGSFCDTYLLQKSRVAKHDNESGERSFHIFYQILSSPEETKTQFWEGLKNTNASSFKYIGTPSTDTIEGLTDEARWLETCAAFEIFGITGEKLDTLIRALCATLQLGNLTFGLNPSNDEDAVITSSEELQKCADILGVSSEAIIDAFTTKVVIAPDQTFKIPLTVAASKDTCDAFAKSIYSMTFTWLVNLINETTRAEDNYKNASMGKEEFSTIGLLDIFGFETFPKNYFEQMCINHSNEKLQHKFIEDVFCSVQEEYEAEGISLDEIKYEDNTDVLSLVEGRLGLIDILNEECFRPKGSDTGFVNKIYSNTIGKQTPLYKRRNFQAHEFGIKHFAGRVRYDATNFVAKNMDDISSQVIELAKTSTNSLIKTGFANVVSKRSSVKAETVWKHFNSQFNSLLNEIKKTDTRYIRCIVPNKEKKPSKTDLKYTLDQLRCAGVMSAVTVSRAAFPNRMDIEIATDRFSILSKEIRVKRKRRKSIDNTMHDLDKTLELALKSMETVEKDGAIKRAYTRGKTKVYFRSGALEYLEEERLLAFEMKAIIIQCWFRCKLAKTYVELLKIRKSGVKTSRKSKYSPRSLFLKLKKMRSFRRKTSFKLKNRRDV